MRGHNRSAFTLIELLVVMAVMAVVLGGLGLALSGGEGTVATQAAQRTVTTMIASARSKAVLNQTRTRLIIHADPPTPGDMSDPRREKYLRFMAVLVDGPSGWEEINDGVELPAGVYVVPPFQLNPPAPLPPVAVISGNDADWEHDRRTILGLDTMEWAYGDPTGAASKYHYIYLEFSPKGTTSVYTDIGGQRYARRIVVAPAATTADYPHFETDADADVLGGMIRRNGSFTLVTAPEGFPQPQAVP